MSDLGDRIEALDVGLFEPIAAQIFEWDRRALLALHASVASTRDAFTYLEIGSYLGGSLQVLVRDPRCVRIVSIDPRPATPPDNRPGGVWEYENNSTERMVALLSALPDADPGKLTTLEASTSELTAADIVVSPDYCFIDGEHTDEAALRDARFCADVLDGRGVIAFHDYDLVGAAIRTFLREVWSDVTMAVAFAGSVFAIELGSGAILRSRVVDRAIASRWHSVVWRTTSRAPSPRPLLAAWAAMPAIDRAALRVREAVARQG